MNKTFTCDCGYQMIYNEPNMKQINQRYYGQLEIDNREKDVVIIAMIEKQETNLIHIERENLPELIKILSQEYEKRKV